MFSLFKKKSDESIDYSALHCDMHSHLIPGIDDGAPDLNASMYLIQGLMSLGYKKIITTPHIMWDMYKNTSAIILSGLKTVTEELDRRKISVEFHAAAEYFMDDHFAKLLEDDQPLLTIKDNLVLVEFSFVKAPMDFKEILFEMQIKGYQPILAHPERYLYFGANKEWYTQIKDTGCLFQLNLLSLSGFYGKAPMELAHFLIKSKYVNLLGTDLHNPRHIEALGSASTDIVKKLLDSGAILNPQL